MSYFQKEYTESGYHRFSKMPKNFMLNYRKIFRQIVEKFYAKLPKSLVDSSKNVYTIIIIINMGNDHNEKI